MQEEADLIVKTRMGFLFYFIFLTNQGDMLAAVAAGTVAAVF